MSLKFWPKRFFVVIKINTPMIRFAQLICAKRYHALQWVSDTCLEGNRPNGDCRHSIWPTFAKMGSSRGKRQWERQTLIRFWLHGTMTGGVEEEWEAAPFLFRPIGSWALVVLGQWEAATCRWARRPCVDRQTKLSAGQVAKLSATSSSHRIPNQPASELHLLDISTSQQSAIDEIFQNLFPTQCDNRN